MRKMPCSCSSTVSCKCLSEVPPEHFLRLNIPSFAKTRIVSTLGKPAICPFQAFPAQIQILESGPGIHGAIWRLASTHIVLHISLSEEAATKCCYKNKSLLSPFIWFFELLCACVSKADWKASERTVNKPVSNLHPKYWLWLLIGVFR